MGIFKKTLILIFFILVGFFLAKSKILQKSQNALFQRNSLNFLEYPIQDNTKIERVKAEKLSVKLETNVVYVPKYWKYGNNMEDKDYLEGFVPNIKYFRDSWNLHNNLQFGYNPYDYEYSIDEIINHFENSKSYHITQGIRNESVFFEWDSEQCKMYPSDTLDSKVFLCKNWINWIKMDIDNKEFVLVRCTLENQIGFCLFEDYIKIFYENSRYGESRCFGETDLYCNFADYLNIISIN